MQAIILRRSSITPKDLLLKFDLQIYKCVKSAPYLNQKNTNWALNMVLFALVLTKFFRIITFRRCSSGINSFNYDKLHQL